MDKGDCKINFKLLQREFFNQNPWPNNQWK